MINQLRTLIICTRIGPHYYVTFCNKLDEPVPYVQSATVPLAMGVEGWTGDLPEDGKTEYRANRWTNE